MGKRKTPPPDGATDAGDEPIAEEDEVAEEYELAEGEGSDGKRWRRKKTVKTPCRPLVVVHLSSTFNT
jgi:hypothetical protein